MRTSKGREKAAQDAADGNTARIDLVEKPPDDVQATSGDGDGEADEKGTMPASASREKQVDAGPGQETEVLQETKPMPAVAWPPAQARPEEPTKPPSLRKRPDLDQVTSGANRLPVTTPQGIFTSELRRALPPWALPLLTAQPISIWIAARIGMTLLALLATMMIPAIAAQGTANWYASPGGPSLTPIVDSIGGVWTRWDGQWYLKIAAEGYNANDGTSAFFPLYPWIVAIFGWLAGERYIWAGIVLSALFFLAALVLLHRLVRFDFFHEDAGRTVFYLAAFPMAFFFWAVYSESLFLFLSVAALLAMRAQKWWWAALAISFAVWTRTTGLLLILPFAWELWIAYHPPIPKDPRVMPPKRPSRWALPALTLPFASLLGFVLWSWFVFHDPLAPISAQADWNRHFSWPWQTIAGAWNVATQAGIQFQPENQAWTYLGSFVFAIIVGALALRWLRPSYSIYLWAGIIFPLFSATPHNPLLSYPRFLLVLFPAFIVLALAGRNRYANQIITWASLLLLALYTIRFVNWYWVA